MNYSNLLKPRYCIDKLVGKAWSLFGAQLTQPDRKPALENAHDLRNIYIEWPTHYGWSPAFKWVDTIRSGLERYVFVQQADIPQLPNNAVQIRVFYHGLEYKVIIDYIDKPETIFDDYLKDCLLYFKMQFRNGGYDDRRIVPGLYVPTSGMDMYHYLPRLRRIRDDSAKTGFDVYGRFGLYRSDPINTSWHDVEMTGRYIRNRALRILETQEKFRYQGGGNLLAITRSLCEVARSKICIDLPGRGPFCHRLVDYLSIGSCIISYPHEATFHSPLAPGKHIVYCRPDFSDLVEICQYYLVHDQERQALIQASREYFDTYLHKDCIAAYYLECLATRLGQSLKRGSQAHAKYDGAA